MAAPLVLSCVNLKGGVGKTALAVNFAAFCGRQPFKTLLVDVDPQANATFSCVDFELWREHAKDNGTIANLLGFRNNARAETSEPNIEKVILRNIFDNVDLVPSHPDLFTIDLDLAARTARELLLKKALQPVIDTYDIVICDCPPNLTIPTQNALALSTHFVVPISPDYLSALGAGLLINRVKLFAEDMDKTLQHVGIVMSRMGRPAKHREEVVGSLRAQFADLVLTEEIKERVAVSQCAEKHISIFDSPDSESANQFRAVSIELLKRMGLK